MRSEDRGTVLTEPVGDLSTQTVSDTPHISQSASQQEYKEDSGYNSHHGKPEEQLRNASNGVPEIVKLAFQDADIPLEVRLLCLHKSYYYFRR
jgi:hypothetical protein